MKKSEEEEDDEDSSVPCFGQKDKKTYLTVKQINRGYQNSDYKTDGLTIPNSLNKSTRQSQSKSPIMEKNFLSNIM